MFFVKLWGIKYHAGSCYLFFCFISRLSFWRASSRKVFAVPKVCKKKRFSSEVVNLNDGGLEIYSRA